MPWQVLIGSTIEGRAGASRVRVGAFVTLLVLVLSGLWYSCQPVVEVRREPWFDQGVLPRVPVESVRVLSSLTGSDCPPLRIVARLHVRGRIFGPDDRAVLDAMRRRAAALGANAIAPTTPSMNDLPVLGWLDKILRSEDEPDERLRHTEEQAGRATAVRCGVIEGEPRRYP